MNDNVQFIELAKAKNGKFSRNRLVTPKELKTITRKDPDAEWFRSHWRYPWEATQYLDQYGTLGRCNENPDGYKGNYIPDHIIVDIDIKNDKEFEVARNILLDLWHEVIEPEKLLESTILFFSGTGFHIMFHKDCFHFQPSPELPKIVKETMDNIYSFYFQPLIKEGFDLDKSLYSTTSLYRLNNSINKKSGLYKIPFEHAYGTLDLKEGAETPKFNFDREYHGFKQLVEFQADADQLDAIMELSDEAIMNTNQNNIRVGHCFHNIWNQGFEKSKAKHNGRHDIILRLASFFKFQDMPKDVALVSILNWLDNASIDYDKKDTKHVIDDIYAKFNSGYGCHDEILDQYCSSECKFYEKKMEQK